MKIETKAIKGVKEVSEDMKNAAITRKKAFDKKPKKKFSKNKLYALTYDEQTDTLTGKEASVPAGMERIKCPKCFGRPTTHCKQPGCRGTGWIIRKKVKKVVAKVTKPITVKAKIVAKVKKAIAKKKKTRKENSNGKNKM